MEQKNGANGHSKFEVENLNLHYGNFHALKDINMQIEEHEITAFHRTVRMRKVHIFKDLKPHE